MTSLRSTRTRVVLLSLAAAGATAAALSVGGANAAPAAAKVPSLQGKTICYIQTASVEYFSQSRDGARLATQALGGKFITFNSLYQPPTELKNVQDCITRHVDGILLFSISKATLTSAARLAKRAGISVVDFYGYVPGTPKDLVNAWVGAHALNAGLLDGQAMVKALGKCAGCKVAQVQGQLGRGEVEDYARGFDQVTKKAGYVDVAKPTSHWSRKEAFDRMQEILSKYPDIKGVFCHNDDTMVGCVQALKQAGKKPGEVKLVTLNASSSGIDLLKQGWLQGDVGWSPSQEGAIATRLLAQAIAKQSVKVPVPCFTPLKLITPSNIPQAVPWTPTLSLAKKWLYVPCENQTAATAFAP